MKLTKIIGWGGRSKLSSVIAFALMSGTCMGADYHWTGAAGDHLWSTAENWTDSSGNAVAAPSPGTAYTYNFTQSAFADNAFNLVVTQDVNVVFGRAIAVHGAGNDAEMTEVTFVSAAGCKLSTLTDADMSVYLYSNSRLTLAVDMSADKSTKDIIKIGEGELVFNLKAANAAMRNVHINSGTYRVASTSAKPNIKVAVNTGAKEGAGAVFDNCLPELTLGGLYIGSLSSSWLNIGRVNLNGTSLNIGNAGNSTSTNLLPMPVFADGGTLNIQNERRMYLEGLPIGGTLAVDRADAQVVSRRTAVRWLFEDADNPLKDVVGSGERVLAPAGMPEVVTDPVRGKVLSISGGKYLKGPDADAGFAELQPQPTNNPYTVAFWLKPDAACDNLGKIFYWGLNTDGKSAALRLTTSVEKGLMFTVWGANRTFATAASPRDGNWHHFAVTYNGLKTFRIYYDGVQVDSFSNNAYYPPNQNFYVGRVYGGWVSNGANPYTGLLDDFLIGSYELPAEGVAKLYADGLAATIAVGSVEAKSAGEVAFAKGNVNLARLSGNALAGGVTLQAEGTTLTVGTEGPVGDDLFRGKIGGAATTLVKEGADYALELSGPAEAVTNVTVKEGTLTLRRPLARNGLVAWYPFDEKRDPGFDAGPARLAAFQAGAGALSTVADGVSGVSLHFPGGTYLHTSSVFMPPSFPRGSAPYTISVWIRPTAEACQGTVPICCWGANYTRQLSMLRFNSTSSINFTTWGAGDDALATDLDSLCDGGWHHVVATYDGSVKKLYFDGVEKASKGNIALNVGAGKPVQIGHCSVDSRKDQYYSGDMDEFMVLDYAWSPDEVATEYARKPSAAVAAESFLPEPAAHWTFDDATAPGADSSANGLTLAVSGEVTLEEGDAICGKAARISSTSGYFKLDEFPSVLPSGGDAFTVIVRYRPDSQQSSAYYSSVVMWGDADNWQSGKMFKVGVGKNRDELIRAALCGWVPGLGVSCRTDMGTDRSRWVTAALVYSPEMSMAKVYVDGEYASGEYSVASDIAAENFAIGSNYAGTQNFYGLIDDVQIYGCTLSSGQIRMIAERLEAGKGTAVQTSCRESVLPAATNVTVADGAMLRVASDEVVDSLAGAGTVEISPLASLTVTDMRGFTGSLVGCGTITVEKGSTLDRSRVSVAGTLTVKVLGGGMTIIIH